MRSGGAGSGSRGARAAHSALDAAGRGRGYGEHGTHGSDCGAWGAREGQCGAELLRGRAWNAWRSGVPVTSAAGDREERSLVKDTGSSRS